MLDTSERYIKMCQQAEEIQQIKHPKRVWLHKSMMGKSCCGFNGDFLWGKPTTEIVEPFVVPMPLAIWLPRQDQLQEMVKGKYPRQYLMVVDFAEYCVNSMDDMSMEQLWLAFVMKEKYGKVWAGEAWETKADEN